MIPRRDALRLVEDCSKRSHLLLASRLMERLAEKLGEDRLEWGLVGLLHDMDFDEVRDDMSKHGVVAAERLRNELPEHCLYAIKAHDHRTGFRPRSKLDKALIAVDSLAGLVEKAQKFKEPTAQDLKEELRKLSSTEPWHKDNIQKCRELGLNEDNFFRLALKAEKGKI